MTTTALAHDPVAALDFLRRFHPGRLWNLVAVEVVRKGVSGLNLRDDEAAPAVLANWMQDHPDANLYYCVSELRPDFAGVKAAKTDVVAAHWLHVDVDPRKGENLAQERERILDRVRAYSPPPTCIVFSGGGTQAFWQLTQAVPITSEADAAEFERYTQQLCIDFETEDRCYSIDHIMRLPGTVNWPNAKKQKRGQVPVRAEVLEWHEERAYGTRDFRKAAVGAKVTSSTVEDVVIEAPSSPVNLEDLSLPEEALAIIRDGRLPEPKKGDDSRSAWLFDAVCRMLRAGVDAARVQAVILDPRYRISESVLEKGRRAERYAHDQVRRARARTTELTHDDKGRVYDTPENIHRAVAQMGVTLEYNEFANRTTVLGLPGFGPMLDDAAVCRLRLRAETEYKLRVAKDRFTDVLLDISRRSTRHPVREYLERVEPTWDGIQRIGSLFPAYMAGDDTPYVRAVGQLWMVAAVRRARQPGCKFDEMVVLESSQGTQKSTALSILAVRKEWFTDSLPLGAATKEQMEATSGKWIVEASDLHGMGAAEVESLKAYLSRDTDRARMAYGRLTEDVPRHFVILGTTNHDRYLRDGTGNRRFLPVRVGAIDLAELERDRDQLWAEAATVEAAGASIRLDRSLWPVAAEEQEQRRDHDGFYDQIRDAIGDKTGVLSASDVWILCGVLPGQRTQNHNARLGAVMKEMGWYRRKMRAESKAPPAWCYQHKDGSTQRLIVVPQPDGKLAVIPTGDGAPF